MAAPTTRFRTIPNSTATTAVDTAGERKGSITGQAVVSTGVGNEVDFGTIDISGGAEDSGVKHIIWDVTADGGNTLVEDFRLWLSLSGFDQAGTVLKFAALSGSDQASPSLTQNYVADATTGSYSFEDLPTPDMPGSINLYPSDEGTNMSLSTTSDDVLMWATYLHVDTGETTGTYRGTTSGYEFQCSLRFSYS